MKAVWVTRSFLDYRIPVYKELCSRLEGHCTLFYNADYVPQRCSDKVQSILGAKAKGLRGEFRIGPDHRCEGMANKVMRIPFQPGLIKAISEEEPDVIISDGFFQWTYAALWLRARRRIPHVMCYERTSHTERNAQWYRKIYRKSVLRWIDAICCSGKLCGEYVKSLGFSSDKVTYGHMVADIEQLQRKSIKVSTQQVQKKRSELGLNRIVFIYVGQIIPRKGIMQLLQAWNTFSKEILQDECSLLLVGGGIQESQCREYCEQNQLDNVCFTGVINYDQLSLYYRCADIFVIPTLEDNWSLVVPEAMACGLPIMCSRYNGCWKELVKNGNGLVFDPLNISDIVKKLHFCLKKSRNLKAMGNNSKQIVKNYTATQAVDAIVQACKMAVSHSQA